MAARTSSAHEIIGRQRELAVIEGFLDLAAERAQTLVITGEAGIGKTRVWKAGLAQARPRGFCTLVSRPGGADVRLARSEEHTSELQSHSDLVCRLLLEKKKKK